MATTWTHRDRERERARERDTHTEQHQSKTPKCQQHLVFPGGHPSKYWPDPMLLNFTDQTRSGVFNMVWPLTRSLLPFPLHTLRGMNHQRTNVLYSPSVSSESVNPSISWVYVYLANYIQSLSLLMYLSVYPSLSVYLCSKVHSFTVSLSHFLNMYLSTTLSRCIYLSTYFVYRCISTSI